MEDDTLSECKSSNAKLLEFITKKENLLRLIHFATRSPEDVSNKSQTYRFPFVCSDILTSSIKLAEAMIPLKPVIEPSHDESTAETAEMTQLSQSALKEEPSNQEESKDETDAESKAI